MPERRRGKKKGHIAKKRKNIPKKKGHIVKKRKSPKAGWSDSGSGCGSGSDTHVTEAPGWSGSDSGSDTLTDDFDSVVGLTHTHTHPMHTYPHRTHNHGIIV